MRRKIITGTVLAVLVGAGAAIASTDFNSYTATQAFCQGTPPSSALSGTTATCGSAGTAKAGSASKPNPMAVHEYWTANGKNGHKTAPLTRIVAKIYGQKIDAKDFPVCTSAMINSDGNSKPYPKGWNGVCPKGSLIGGGPVNALLMPPSSPTAKGSTCNPYLFIYNAGIQNYKGKPTPEQTFFFTEAPYAPGSQYTCLNGAAKTGGAPAYPGYITEPSAANGNTYTENIPLIPQVSTHAAGFPLYASLLKLNVVYKKVSWNGHPYGVSIGCKNGKRPYSFTFYAQNYQGQQPPTQTTTISHTAACS